MLVVSLASRFCIRGNTRAERFECHSRLVLPRLASSSYYIWRASRDSRPGIFSLAIASPTQDSVVRDFTPAAAAHMWRYISRKPRMTGETARQQDCADDDLLRLEVPDDTLGLHMLYAPDDEQDADLDVVFLHGIGGDSFSTWTDKQSKVMWPAEFLPKTAKFKNSRIMVFGYNAQVWVAPFKTKTQERLFTFGEELMVALKDHRVETYQRKRPLVLVGHSLGGIVLKSGLLYGKMNPSQFNDLIESTKALVFFGTPHQGADIATWSTYLTRVSSAIGIKSSRVLQELATWSTTLLELNKLFSEHISELMLTTFFELEDTYGVRVVNEGSARVNNVKKEAAQGLHRNHLTICKFAKETESDYRKVEARFQAIATDIRLDREAGAAVPRSECVAESPADAEAAEEIRVQELQARLEALRVRN